MKVGLSHQATMNRKHSSMSAGFTPAELLIVVAIVVVLATLLMAMITRKRAHENAQAAICQNNLRQIGLAMQLYIVDHSGRFPLSSDGKLRGVQYWPKNIVPYGVSKQTFECPTMNNYFRSYALGSHYLYNTERMNYSGKGAVGGWFPRLRSSITAPTQVWAVRDTTFQAGGPRSNAQLIKGCGRPQWWPILHKGASHVLLIDGHVAWLNPQQAEQMECDVPPPDMFTP